MIMRRTSVFLILLLAVSFGSTGLVYGQTEISKDQIPFYNRESESRLREKRQEKEKLIIEDFKAVINREGDLEVTGFLLNNSLKTLKTAQVRLDLEFRRIVVHYEYITITDLFPFGRQFFQVKIKGNYDLVKYKIINVELTD